MYLAVPVAIAISVLSLLPKIKPKASLDTRLLGIWFATERGIDFALAIFLLLILFILSRYPVRLSRNVVVHATLYTLFFMGTALVLLLRVFAVRGAALQTTNLVMSGISCGCIFAWIVLLTRKGEEVTSSYPSISKHREQLALRQLENLNATLLKVSHK
jgi:hypothetical protein